MRIFAWRNLIVIGVAALVFVMIVTLMLQRESANAILEERQDRLNDLIEQVEDANQRAHRASERARAANERAEVLLDRMADLEQILLQFGVRQEELGAARDSRQTTATPEVIQPHEGLIGPQAGQVPDAEREPEEHPEELPGSEAREGPPRHWHQPSEDRPGRRRGPQGHPRR